MPAPLVIILGGGGSGTNPVAKNYKPYERKSEPVVPITLVGLDEVHLEHYHHGLVVDEPFLKFNQPQYSYLGQQISEYDADQTARSRQHPLQEVVTADALEDADANPIYGLGDEGVLSPLEQIVRGY